jgi:hypothetical protein
MNTHSPAASRAAEQICGRGLAPQAIALIVDRETAADRTVLIAENLRLINERGALLTERQELRAVITTMLADNNRLGELSRPVADAARATLAK